MKAYKFIIPGDRFYEDVDNPDLAWKGCLAVALAENEEQARSLLRKFAAERGYDVRWLKSAQVHVIDIFGPAALAIAML